MTAVRIENTSGMRRRLLRHAAVGLLAVAGLARAEEPPTGAGPADDARARAAAVPESLRRLEARVGRPGGLTAEEAARRAVLSSPAARGRAAGVLAAEAQRDRAEIAYFPRLLATARYARLSPVDAPEIGPPGAGFSLPVILDQYLVQASVTVPLSDYLSRLPGTRDAAERSRTAAEHGKVAAENGAALSARLGYYAWARARLSEEVTHMSVEQATRHLEQTRASQGAGRAPRVEVLRAEALVAMAELTNERARNAAALTEVRLRTMMHESSVAPLEIGEDLLSPLPDVEVGSEDALLSLALARRPEMRAIEDSLRAIGDEERATRAGAMPRLDAFGNAYLANPSQRVIPQEEKWRVTWDVGVQLSWSPNDAGTAGAATRGVDARRRKLESERAERVDALRDEISAARVAWQEAQSARSTAERGLTAAEEAYRVRRELFELGRGMATDVVDAEAEVLRARLELIQASVDARVARVRLEHAVGGPSVRATAPMKGVAGPRPRPGAQGAQGAQAGRQRQARAGR